MLIYLPIAEMSVDAFVILALGAVAGLASGLFGVGGGFIMTPALLFYGVPPTVAVGSQAPLILASSFSSALQHLRRGSLDLRMGAVMSVGGLLGSAAGVGLFRLLRELGQVELVVTVGYVLLLSTIGLLTAWETLGTLVRRRRPGRPERRRRPLLHRLPLRMRFPTSHLYISPLAPAAVGFAAGMLAALFGVGGGFLLVPAMIYVLRMPTGVVIGTSHLQIAVVAVFTTMMHAWANRSVDIVLALLGILGSVVGAQYGTRLALRLRGEWVRGLFAVLVLLVAARLLADLVVPPADPFVVIEE